jgi:PII-like signaling protein
VLRSASLEQAIDRCRPASIGEGLSVSEALKLTTYFGERSRIGGRLLADELLDVHARHEVRASVLLRGVQGFGAKHRRRSDRLLTLSEDLPLVSMAVDTRERVEALAHDVGTIGREGLITLERASLHGAKTLDRQGLGDTVKLTVYLGRHERVNGSPAFVAVCQTLQDCGVAGATVLLGVDGTMHGQRRRARFFARNANVPLLIVAVGEAERIERALEHVGRLLAEPLFTIELVRVCKRDGVSQAKPHEPATAKRASGELSIDIEPPSAKSAPTTPAKGGPGTQLRQKLTIVTSEAARHENRPIYLELVRRLRGANAAGATSLRGIWGFHGEHPPHGDRLLAIRRHVPVVTETIDTPERIAALFPIVDELTHERGLVTSELIPVTSALHKVAGL